MSDAITTYEQYCAALIAQYPALADRERYAALWQLAAKYSFWHEATYEGLLNRLHLNTWDVDRAEVLAQIEISHDDALNRVAQEYQEQIMDIQRDYQMEVDTLKYDAHAQFKHIAAKWAEDDEDNND